MSNYLAIATVTACLKQLLQPAATSFNGSPVTVLRPDLIAGSGNSAGVNVYMYQVMPNTAWRNEDLPARRSDGQLITRPRVALDLYYIISCYGPDNEFAPQRMLGNVVKIMHETPVLTRDFVQDTVSSTSYVSGSDLMNEIELVKFTPTAMSTEEISKLWAAFQTTYLVSVVYHGTVVLIDSSMDPTPALPVRSRNLYVVPFNQPIIERVLSADGLGVPIDASSTVLIKGKGLRGDPTASTKVRVAGTEVVPDQLNDQQITVDFTSVLLAGYLRAGVQGIQVVQPRLIGTPAVDHTGVESNVVPFVLHPKITALSATNYSGTAMSRTCDITLTISPVVGKTQRVILFLNEMTDTDPKFYSFVVPDRGSDSSTITVHVTGVKGAWYIVRVQVDGAQSLLEEDTDPLNTTHTMPKLEILAS